MRTRSAARSRSIKELHKLATVWGIDIAYRDVTGRRCESSQESLLAVLPILGATVSGMAEVPDALRERRRTLWQRCLEPVEVAWDGAIDGIRLRLPLRQAHGSIECRLQGESRDEMCWFIRLEEVPNQETGSCEGIRYVVKQLPLPHRLPSGYYHLSVELHGHQLENARHRGPDPGI